MDVLPDRVALALALLHSLWQGALVALLLAVLLPFLRRRSPQARYLVSLSALGACCAIFLGTCIRQHARSPLRGVTPLTHVHQTALPPLVPPPHPVVDAPSHSTAPVPLPEDPYLRWLPLLAQAWCAGALLMTLRLAGGHMLIAHQIRSARPAPRALARLWSHLASRTNGPQPPPIRILEGLRSPLVAGWLRPVLLVPAGLWGPLDPTALEALLAHELAHIRRHDPLVNALQGVVEALLFYHPAVWWISRRIRHERELCCDDQAAAWCSDPLILAEALTALGGFSRGTPMAALGAAGGDLTARVRRLLPGRSPRTTFAWAPMLALALVIVAATTSHLLHASPGARDPMGFSLLGEGRTAYLWAQASDIGPDARMLAHAGVLPWGRGVASRTIDASTYRGHRVRFTARMRPEEIREFGGLWMRIEGPSGTMAHDTAFTRGSGDWETRGVVLDVPQDAQLLVTGVVLGGRGRLWMDLPRLELVDARTPTTYKACFPGGTNWMLAGNRPDAYSVDIDPGERLDGAPVLRFASTCVNPGGFGTLVAGRPVGSFRNRPVRLSAWVRGENIKGWGGLWLRADGASGQTLAFDNMSTRPLKGTFPWQRIEMVLEIPETAARMEFGVLLQGAGRLWFTDPELTPHTP